MVVFLTENYAAKVYSGTMNDNVCFEFGHAGRTHGDELVLCVMEPSMKGQRQYRGTIQSYLGGLLYTDMTDDAVDTDPIVFRAKCADLAAKIMAIYRKKVESEQILKIEQ